MIRLRVWANARPMGWFGHSAGDYFFEYDTEWLQQPGGFVLAPQFALAPARYTGALVRHFFENLLPEGEALDDIMAALQLRGASYFEVLGKLGAELPGVLSLLPPDARPQLLQQYTPLPYEALSQRLRAHACHQEIHHGHRNHYTGNHISQHFACRFVFRHHTNALELRAADIKPNGT